jgi:hypothetical protein
MQQLQRQSASQKVTCRATAPSSTDLRTARRAILLSGSVLTLTTAPKAALALIPVGLRQCCVQVNVIAVVGPLLSSPLLNG